MTLNMVCDAAKAAILLTKQRAGTRLDLSSEIDFPQGLTRTRSVAAGAPNLQTYTDLYISL